MGIIRVLGGRALKPRHPPLVTPQELGREMTLTPVTRTIRIALASVVWLQTWMAASADEPFFIGLGDLPGGAYYSFASDISADGTTIVGTSSSEASGPGDSEAFRWTLTQGMQGLGDLEGGRFESRGRGVSGDGSVVAGTSTSGLGFEGFIWTEQDGMVALGDLPGCCVASEVFDVSNDASVVVGMGTTESGQEAVRWTVPGGIEGLGDLDGGDYRSEAFGVSGDGSVIVGFGSTDVGQEAFRWTDDEGMQALGSLPGEPPGGSARAASFDGTVIVGRARSGTFSEAFRWTSQDGMIGLGDLPGGFSSSGALGVSADGTVVVGRSSVSGPTEAAFIWDQVHGMRNLQSVLTDDLKIDLEGWELSWSTAVSADGLTIAGFGINPSGDSEAWVARIPEPRVDLLSILAFLVASPRRWASGVRDQSRIGGRASV